MTDQELDLLAKVVWAEARGESPEGQQAVAETLGNSTMSMEITEEQTDLLEIPEGYTGSRIVLINAQMPEMETGETAG